MQSVQPYEELHHPLGGNTVNCTTCDGTAWDRVMGGLELSHEREHACIKHMCNMLTLSLSTNQLKHLLDTLDQQHTRCLVYSIYGVFYVLAYYILIDQQRYMQQEVEC